MFFVWKRDGKVDNSVSGDEVVVLGYRYGT